MCCVATSIGGALQINEEPLTPPEMLDTNIMVQILQTRAADIENRFEGAFGCGWLGTKEGKATDGLLSCCQLLFVWV